MIFYGASLNKVSYAVKPDEHLPAGFLTFQKDPFYFVNPVPAKIKLRDKVDLSFFRNQLIVFTYRYKIEIPKGVEPEIDWKLITWSPWINDDLIPIKVPTLYQEGGYKLVIEYKTQKSSETKRFEKPFYVYRAYPATGAIAANYNTSPNPNRTAVTTSQATNTTNPKINPETTSLSTNKTTTETTTKEVPATGDIAKGKKAVNENQIDLKDVKIKIDIIPKIVSQSGNRMAEASDEPAGIENKNGPDYDELLADAIEKKDTTLINESVKNGAGSTLKGKNGGNIFHLLDGTIAGEYLISTLKNKGFSINESDNDGNSPLHSAILSGERGYASSLINQGADLNVKNNMELSPLHLAVILKDEEAVEVLLDKGAGINLKGNTGYTPLHIASELNYVEIAKNLLNNGAKNGIKTNQGLTPKTIAEIQKNLEIVKMISGKGTDTLNSVRSNSNKSVILLNSDKQNPKINFNLPYNSELAKKRQFNKVIQTISIPVFILSTAGTIYVKSEANHYYSLSKTAETEEMAKYYYDKTTQYDKYAYISIGISLVSVYGFIHSTISKKNINSKMYKTF